MPDGRRREAPREPELPDEANADILDRTTRDAVAALGGQLAASMARHLAAVLLLLDVDPDAALEHAVFAKARAARLAPVREALGLAAYRVGNYDLARSELRAARRMTGRADLLPLLADCERGLGRPDRALQVAAEPASAQLGASDRIELSIVVAGARRDLKQFDAALGALDSPAMRTGAVTEPVLRLRYAYADTLAAAGRREEAHQWFARVAREDLDQTTDAADRAAGLHG